MNFDIVIQALLLIIALSLVATVITAGIKQTNNSHRQENL
jgi:Na+-transporting NADH:ubiquinone oxidoreductase subunit NqrC